MSDPIRLAPKPATMSYSEWRARNIVAIWNACVSVGQPVRYHGGPVDAEGFASRTRGPASVRTLGQNSYAVVAIEGIANPVPLDHVRLEGKR